MLSAFSSVNVGGHMFLSAESHGFSPSTFWALSCSGQEVWAAVQVPYRELGALFCSTDCCNPAWIWLLFGDVSAYPLSVEMIPPLILVFCLTRVYLEQAVCSANTPAFLHCISSWKECILLGLCSCIYVFLVSFFHKAFFWWAKVKY